MKVIYIAGKFRGPNAWVIENNIRRAEEAAFEVAKLGAAPLCPHTNTRFFHGTQTDQWWLDATLALLRKCDAIFLIKGWEESAGARSEHAEAQTMRIPIFIEEQSGYIGLNSWLAISEYTQKNVR
jgi:hypothetical protein